MDFKDKAGLYFINEFKKNIGEEAISDLKEVGIDFELIKIQQHYLYRQHERIKSKSKNDDFVNKEEKSLLDYSWDKDGKVLDQLNLDEIVKKYIHYLTEVNSFKTSTDYNLEKKDKGFKKKSSN